MITTTRFRDVSREEIEQCHAAPSTWESLRGKLVQIVCTPRRRDELDNLSTEILCEGPYFVAPNLQFPNDPYVQVALCPHWIEID